MLNTVAPAAEHADARLILHYNAAHAHALRHQLRKDAAAVPVRDLHIPADALAGISASPNPADAILNEASKALRRLQAEGVVDSIQMMGVHTHLSELGFVQVSEYSERDRQCE
jgi:predicted membrane chloride channel (bestrophin family)